MAGRTLRAPRGGAGRERPHHAGRGDAHQPDRGVVSAALRLPGPQRPRRTGDRACSKAPSSSAVADQLFSTGITPVAHRRRPRPAAAAASEVELLRSASASSGRASSTCMLFCRQMHTLLKAGVPIVRGARRACRNRRRTRRCAQSLGDVREKPRRPGASCRSACARHPKVFSPLHGEPGARRRAHRPARRGVPAPLRVLRVREEDARATCKAALRYPTIVIAAMAIAHVHRQHLSSSRRSARCSRASRPSCR